MPVVVAALTILDMPGQLHSVLSDRRVQSAALTLQQIGRLNQQDFFQAVGPQIPPSSLQFLQQVPWPDLLTAINDLLQASRSNQTSLFDQEFDRLVRAASGGAPAVPNSQIGAPPLFEVRLQDVRRFAGPASRMNLRVTPVSRLRMVVVQRGYQRVDPQTGDEVSVAFQQAGQNWYPGAELFGEGIFIDLDGRPLSLGGKRVQAWSARNVADQLSRSEPAHVWWHSLSHRLLQALSIDSGYSSAAIRERVYIPDDAAGHVSGGLLLYTVQPGGDGTLGGLVALVDRFHMILRSALLDVDTCSNDPLCEEAPSAGAEGSACYSCMLVSETSCEHRNLGLDRLLLADNLP